MLVVHGNEITVRFHTTKSADLVILKKLSAVKHSVCGDACNLRLRH